MACACLDGMELNGVWGALLQGALHGERQRLAD